MDYFKCELVSRDKLSEACYLLGFSPLNSGLASLPNPGQFYNIKVSPLKYPYLMRPFSLFDLNRSEGILYFLVKVVGIGTELLTHSQTGDIFKLLGPLGKGFTMPEDRSQPLFFVAGGIGLAPLFMLNKQLWENGFRNIRVFYGERNEEQLLKVNELKDMSKSCYFCIEECKTGVAKEEHFLGLPTTKLLEELNKLDESPLVYCCGPREMLKQMKRYADERELWCEISCEENMACGVGACHGCSIKTREGFKRVCKEGPIFKAKEVIFQ